MEPICVPEKSPTSPYVSRELSGGLSGQCPCFCCAAGEEAKEGLMGTAANADAHRPRPQSASDRSTPSQVGPQSFACNLQQCCRTAVLITDGWKHSVGMPAADLHACLMHFLYTAYSLGTG